MIGIYSFGRLIWRARALRFLTLCLLCWTGVRALLLSNPMAQPLPPAAPPMPWVMPNHGPMVTVPEKLLVATTFPVTVRHPAKGIHRGAATVRFAEAHGPPVWLAANRDALRFALLRRLLPELPLQRQHAALQAGDAVFERRPILGTEAVSAGPLMAPSMGQGRNRGGWSGSGWLFLREGGSALGRPALAAQLGGNQAGVIIGYGFGASGRWRAYARAVAEPTHGGQREAALGLAFAPLVHVPVNLHLEQRLAPRGRGRTALALMASGGVSSVYLPAGFRLDAYAQAGIVGTRAHDLFGDAALAVEHDLARHHGARFALGGVAAVAAQPGAARFDIGPRLSLHLPRIAKGSRIALDWRQRVAGDARPGSGLALTLSTDF